MTKTLLALLTLTLITGAASAQQRTFYDSFGKVVGRASIDSQGTKTIYDASGKVVGRDSTTGGGTTAVYDERGRVIGTRR